MADFTYDAVAEFLEYAGNHGLLNASTAQAYRVGVSKIENSLTEEERADVRTIDVDTVFQRFVNKSNVSIKPRTLRDYRRRVEISISEFLEWRRDPTAYKPKGKPKSSGSSDRKVGNAPAEKSQQQAKPAATPKEAPEPAKGILNYPYPLREDFLANVQVPRDLKLEEANRLAAFLRTLAVDYNPG